MLLIRLVREVVHSVDILLPHVHLLEVLMHWILIELLVRVVEVGLRKNLVVIQRVNFGPHGVLRIHSLVLLCLGDELLLVLIESGDVSVTGHKLSVVLMVLILLITVEILLGVIVFIPSWVLVESLLLNLVGI